MIAATTTRQRDRGPHLGQRLTRRFELRSGSGKPEGTLIAVENHLIGDVATDVTHVYWTNQGSVSDSGTPLRAGALRRRKR